MSGGNYLRLNAVFIVLDMVTVLFVCVHNAGRSQMAEAILNDLAEGRHRGISAGSQPGEEVNPVAVKAMAELGIDLGDGRPKLLTGEMVEEADLVITMGCGENVCPIVPKEVMDWGLDDPHGQTIERVREIRDEIQRRVVDLIATLNSRALARV
jgi:arsenate reductase